MVSHPIDPTNFKMRLCSYYNNSPKRNCPKRICGFLWKHAQDIHRRYLDITWFLSQQIIESNIQDQSFTIKRQTMYPYIHVSHTDAYGRNWYGSYKVAQFGYWTFTIGWGSNNWFGNAKKELTRWELNSWPLNKDEWVSNLGWVSDN